MTARAPGSGRCEMRPAAGVAAGQRDDLAQRSRPHAPSRARARPRARRAVASAGRSAVPRTVEGTSGRSPPAAMPRARRARAATPSAPILSSLSSATSASPCWAGGDAGRVEQRRAARRRWIQADGEVVEPERGQHLADRRQQLDLDDRRGRPDRVDVALVELAEASARRPVGAPHRLNLIALEEPRQLVLVLRDDARERHGQVVAQREVGLAARLVLAAA